MCLFTGISGTLGRDFAARYADSYTLVGVFNSRSPAGASKALESGGSLEPGSFFTAQADLGADGAVDELAERVVDRVGAVDLLVNAAVYRRFGPVLERKFVQTLEWQFAMNVCIPTELVAALTRLVWRHDGPVNQSRRRNVVNLSSTAGHHVYPGHGQSGYAGSKAALDLVTRHLASELAAIGVRANAVAPNTFPGLVPTQAVSEAVRRYDDGDANGEILVIDTDGEYLLGLPGPL